jgi:hypothetical protein
MRAMPFRRDRPEIDIEHVRRATREILTPWMIFHGLACETEDFVQAFQRACLHAELVGKVLDGYAGAQLREQVMGSEFVWRAYGRLGRRDRHEVDLSTFYMKPRASPTEASRRGAPG